MNHPIRCRCGTLSGHVVLPATASRAVCYCKDCQAYAHYLRHPGDVLDAAGGTDIVAMPPSHVCIDQGADSLACLSLTERGLLRWYARCCSTPIGNTPRNRKVHYVGLVHTCLQSQPLEASFGPAAVRINTESARTPVTSTTLVAFLAMFKLMGFMLAGWLSGRYRHNPFFDAATGKPIHSPQVLTTTELMALKASI